MTCHATTLKGTLCKRSDDKGYYCWQHDRMYNHSKVYTDNCQATTQKGSQCSRRATKGKYCWQHDRMYEQNDSSDDDDYEEVIIKPKNQEIKELKRLLLEQQQKIDNLIENKNRYKDMCRQLIREKNK